MGKGIFITATGTDIGKTYITALLVKKLREAQQKAGYYKAALSGAEKQKDGTLLPGDADFVVRTAKIKETPQNLVSYIYETAVSPHLAAQREGNPVSMEKIIEDYKKSCTKYDFVTVEGSGGIICPIRWDEQEHILLEDIIKKLALGTIVVSSALLGSINACVLTISYLKAHNIPIKGIILNNYDDADFMQQDNKKMMEELTQVPVLATVGNNAKDINIDPKLLMNLYE